MPVLIRRMRPARKVAASALAVVTAATWLTALVLLVACGSESPSTTPTGEPTASPSATPSATPSTSATSEPTTTAGVDDPRKDVRIVKCNASSSGQLGVAADIEITNSTSQPWRYAGTIIFKSPGGKQVAEGLFAKNRIEPGKTVADDIPGDTFDRVPLVHCEVGEVKRLPPK